MLHLAGLGPDATRYFTLRERQRTRTGRSLRQSAAGTGGLRRRQRGPQVGPTSDWKAWIQWRPRYHFMRCVVRVQRPGRRRRSVAGGRSTWQSARCAHRADSPTEPDAGHPSTATATAAECQPIPATGRRASACTIQGARKAPHHPSATTLFNTFVGRISWLVWQMIASCCLQHDDDLKANQYSGILVSRSIPGRRARDLMPGTGFSAGALTAPVSGSPSSPPSPWMRISAFPLHASTRTGKITRSSRQSSAEFLFIILHAHVRVSS